MSRFDQRLRQDLQDPDFAAGYYEQDAELELIRALDAIRRQERISNAQLAQHSGLSREAISRLFHTERPNPTLDTLTDLLRALHLQAEVTLRRVPEGTPPIRIKEPTNVSGG